MSLVTETTSDVKPEGEEPAIQLEPTQEEMERERLAARAEQVGYLFIFYVL